MKRQQLRFFIIGVERVIIRFVGQDFLMMISQQNELL